MSRILVLDQTNRPYRFTKSNRRHKQKLFCVRSTRSIGCFPSHGLPGECTTIGHLVQFRIARARAEASGVFGQPLHDSARGMRIIGVSSYRAQASHAWPHDFRPLNCRWGLHGFLRLCLREARQAGNDDGGFAWHSTIQVDHVLIDHPDTP